LFSPRTLSIDTDIHITFRISNKHRDWMCQQRSNQPIIVTRNDSTRDLVGDKEPKIKATLFPSFDKNRSSTELERAAVPRR